MTRIQETFSRLKSEGRKALIPFVTAGDPPLDELGPILRALEEAGADMIEVGIPFSDPIADGPTIQASSQRALDRGVTPREVISAMKSSGVSVPLVAMGYLNPMMAMGLPVFAREVKAAGAEGVIVCDLTPDEESEEWNQAAEEGGLDRIYLAAPTSTDQRIDAVCAKGTGFVYAVSRTGVTGAGSQVPPEVASLVNKIKARTELPVCVGFGISRPEHVKMVCQAADGAVVGSSLVQLLAETWNAGEGKQILVERVRQLKEAAV